MYAYASRVLLGPRLSRVPPHRREARDASSHGSRRCSDSSPKRGGTCDRKALRCDGNPTPATLRHELTQSLSRVLLTPPPMHEPEFSHEPILANHQRDPTRRGHDANRSDILDAHSIAIISERTSSHEIAKPGSLPRMCRDRLRTRRRSRPCGASCHHWVSARIGQDPSACCPWLMAEVASRRRTQILSIGRSGEMNCRRSH